MNTTQFPSITLLIAAYNEESCLAKKIENSLSLAYPNDKKHIVVITDGSNDSSFEICKQFVEVTALHQPERRGKMAAIDRAMETITTDIVVFSDANTDLNITSLTHIAEAFADPKVGMVAGEKRVTSANSESGIANEGLYWKYESWLKKLDSDTTTVVGAAGELFAIRTSLHKPLPSDTILDDFMLSMEVIKAGYRIKYVPEAYAIESSSLNLAEEWKRKVRISAGGIQSTVRSFSIANPFKYGWISFSYLVHRIARWTIAPLALLISLISSMGLVFVDIDYAPISILSFLAVLFTLISIKKGVIFLPGPLKTIIYFLFMNFSVIAGWFRYAKGSQTVLWEKAKR